MNLYLAGDLVTVTATFTNSASVPTDPSTITLKVGRKGTSEKTYVYLTDAIVTRVSTGVYQANLDTTGYAQGQYTYFWLGTGAVQAVNDGVFAVQSQPF